MLESDKRFRILLVEDDMADAKLLSDGFSRYGDLVSIRHITDGTKAMSVIGKMADLPADKCPHLIVLDVNLPDIDGAKLYALSSFSVGSKRIPTIIFTGGEHDGLEVCAKADPRSIFMHKPDSLEGYQSISAEMLRHAAVYLQPELKKAG